jgi:hypothetical protein
MGGRIRDGPQGGGAARVPRGPWPASSRRRSTTASSARARAQHGSGSVISIVTHRSKLDPLYQSLLSLHTISLGVSDLMILTLLLLYCPQVENEKEENSPISRPTHILERSVPPRQAPLEVQAPQLVHQRAVATGNSPTLPMFTDRREAMPDHIVAAPEVRATHNHRNCPQSQVCPLPPFPPKTHPQSLGKVKDQVQSGHVKSTCKSLRPPDADDPGVGRPLDQVQEQLERENKGVQRWTQLYTYR